MTPDTCHDPGDRGGGRACDTCGAPTERYVVVMPDGSPAHYRPRERKAGTRCVPRCSACRLMWMIAAAARPQTSRRIVEARLSRVRQTRVAGESWLEDPEFLRRLLEDRS